MLTWIDILRFATSGNPSPDQKVKKSDDEWREILTEDQYYVTRKKGTERPFSSDMCTSFEPGKYACVCCKTPLFDSTQKFDSGTGWPSFTQPVKPNAVSYYKDHSHGMYRIEALCNSCGAHLGHVFQDGPKPGGLRYCINAVSLEKIIPVAGEKQTVVFGGGCFWCTEAIFQKLKGVEKVVSGYSGGSIKNPTYHEVTSGLTGHAEVVEVTYDPTIISFEDLLRIHMTTHDPTTLNRQGADRGTQYRSVIFYRSEKEKSIIENVLTEVSPYFENPIVTELAPFEYFYKAEDYHQNYFELNKNKNPYCSIVIEPKLKKFRELYQAKWK